jgi:DNA polymerase-3 subunit gamma/tau
MAGDVATAIALLEEQYNGGADPAQILLEMAEFVHLATRFRLAPATAESAALTPEERRRGQSAAEKLEIPALTRAWQILMKGVDELRGSQRPLQAADMVLVRLAYASALPTPGEALRHLGFGAGAEAPPASARSAPAPAQGASASVGRTAPQPARAPVAAPAVRAQTAPALATFEALVALAEEKRDMGLKLALESDVRLVRFEPGRIEFELAPGGSRDLASTLMRKLQAWTDERWMVSVVGSGGAPTVREQQDTKARARRSTLEADPAIAAVLAHFPGAQIVSVRGQEEPKYDAEGAPARSGDEFYDEAGLDDED